MDIVKNKKVIFGIVGVVILFIAYNALLKPSDTFTGVSSVNGSGSDSINFSAGKDVLALLTDLKKIRIDTTAFDNPIFRTLTDFTIPLDPEPQGRSNPFSPIGVDTVSDNGSTSGDTVVGNSR